MFKASVTLGQDPLPRLKPGEQGPTLLADTCRVRNPRYQLTWAAEQGEKGGRQAPATKRGHLARHPQAPRDQLRAALREMDVSQEEVAWSRSLELWPSMSW